MLLPEITEPFIKWLNPPKRGDRDREDQGLREDAPDEAKKAFARYLEIKHDNEARGVRA